MEDMCTGCDYQITLAVVKERYVTVVKSKVRKFHTFTCRVLKCDRPDLHSIGSVIKVSGYEMYSNSEIVSTPRNYEKLFAEKASRRITAYASF